MVAGHSPLQHLRTADTITADLYDSGCSVLAAVTFPDQVVL